MHLSLREAATILGRSQRTVRDWLVRGRIAGRKRDGRWVVERRDLPMTDEQRAVLQSRAERIRESVERALPSRAAARRGDRRRSIADLDTFRAALAMLRELRAAGPDGARPARRVRAGLVALAEGVHAFDAGSKLRALRRARREFSRAAAWLLVEPTATLDAPCA